MCGRYVSVRSDADLVDEFDVEEVLGEPLAPSWNIAPTDPVRVITHRRPHGADPDAAAVNQLRSVRWGLIPNWSRTASGGAKMINARVETVTSKPAFKAAAGRRRALVPALGYYEWQRRDGGKAKIPYFLHGIDDDLVFAGLYEIWRNRELSDDHPDAWLWTCTIITRQASDTLGHIHDRCPVLVPATLRAAWLDCADGAPGTAQALLDEFPEPHLIPTEVGAAVGNVRNNSPELIRPIADGAAPAAAEPDTQPLW